MAQQGRGDTDERQRAFARVASEIDQYAYALDQARIVSMTDVKGRILYVNDRFCEISGYARAELIGQDHRLLSSGHHPKAFIRDLWRTINQGRVWTGELKNRARDGSFFWVDTTIVPLVDRLGESTTPSRFLAIRTDITERKRIEAELQEKEVMAQFGRMAAVIAHEVKNPLAGISAVLQVIAARLASGPEGSAQAQMLRDAIGRIGGLSDVLASLLELARPRVPSLRETDLLDVVLQAAGMLSERLAASGVDLTIEGPRARVATDPLLMCRSIYDLARHSIAALEEAVGVTDKSLVIRIEERLSDVEISIADNGPALSAAACQDVFKPFFSTRSSGTGLDLAIARQTIGSHGGSVEVASGEGGTTVRVVLPRTRGVVSEAPRGDGRDR